MSVKASAPAQAICRVLRVPQGPPRASYDQAHRLFSASIAISAARCLLTYIVVPIAAPFIGVGVADNPGVGIPLSVVALVFDVRAVRQFWLADHRWKWHMTAVYCVVIAMVTGLLVHDLLRL